MPQASDELRAKWPGGDSEACRYLEGRGYKLRSDWQWDVTDVTDELERDVSAIQYLIDEWDYGGLVVPAVDQLLKALKAFWHS